MKVDIKGLTPSTIVLNTIGIIIRGDSKNQKLYPGSCAYNIEIDNSEKMNELNSLLNAGLITYKIKEDDKNVENVILSSETTSFQQDSEKVDEKPKKKKARGRPRGSVNKSTLNKKGIKKISKVQDKDPTENDDLENQDAVVMTENGPSNQKTSKPKDAQFEDERIKASLEAMEELEKEEQENNEFIIDEDKLDESEKMGSKAVIGTGEGDSKSVDMSNSIVPEADEIKKKGINFIDADDNPEDDADQAFLDKDNNIDDVDFLEY